MHICQMWVIQIEYQTQNISLSLTRDIKYILKIMVDTGRFLLFQFGEKPSRRAFFFLECHLVRVTSRSYFLISFECPRTSLCILEFPIQLMFGLIQLPTSYCKNDGKFKSCGNFGTPITSNSWILFWYRSLSL